MTSPHRPRYLEHLPAYLVGALDPEAARELELHLGSGCPTCDRELARWLPVCEALAEALPAVEPSPATRAELLSRLAGRRRSGPPS